MSSLPKFFAEPSVYAADRHLSAREAARADARARESESGAYACSAGHSNPSLNRYFNVLPYDRTRVRLTRDAYINANYITEPNLTASTSLKQRTWMASQGPLEHTAGDFLSLACDLEPAPRIIVQLTPLVERGTIKCSAYLPPVYSSWTFPLSADPNRQVTVTRRASHQSSSYFKTNDVEISSSSSQQPPSRVTHFELVGWPDHGVPQDPRGVINMIQAIDELHAREDPELQSPILAHCSAGVGRTGTLIVLSSLLHQLGVIKEAWQGDKWSDDTDPVTVTVDAVRDQRAMMVQTSDQLAFVRRAFKEAWVSNASSA